MNIKSIVLAAVLVAFTGSAMAANVPVPPVKTSATSKSQIGTACKIVKGKKKCHKSKYKSKMDVKPYAGKPKASK